MNATALQALADRMALEQLVIDYANAIDAREYDRLDQVFTPDAKIDYRAMGGIDGDYPKVKKWLADALAPFPSFMHFVGNCSFAINGDGATGRVACINPMVIPTPDEKTDTMILGLWYQDRYTRTEAGWRICTRTEVRGFDYNMPQWMKMALKLD